MGVARGAKRPPSNKKPVRRRQAAILAADIVSHTRLISRALLEQTPDHHMVKCHRWKELLYVS